MPPFGGMTTTKYPAPWGGVLYYWARIGKIAEENPDLSYDFIKNILLGKIEAESGWDLKKL